MSMSQEEIESLMNGLDFEEDDSSSETSVEENEPQGNMSEDDINELIAQTEDMNNNEESSSDESVDDILNSLENAESEEISTEETNIDDILKELEQEEPEKVVTEVENTEEVKLPESVVEEPTLEETIASSSENVSSDNIDELLSSIDGIEDETSVEEVEDIVAEVPKIESNESISNKNVHDIDTKINSGVFPLPVEEDTKVVNQLNAVANDSEEKATKIFDVLSNILDYNNAIQNDVQALSSFNEKQIAMLSSLSQKFPNIDAFSQNLEHAQQMGDYISDANEKLNDGNTEIFQAMELMQYHDINRQKIERVMSVIRKLTVYLNNLFEDDNNRAEVAVANHIHGDNTDDLVDDEGLEALISEFNN